MNKVSRGDEIPAELFQILKDDAIKVLHSICQQTWKIQQQPQDCKRSVFIPILKKGNAKVFKEMVGQYHRLSGHKFEQTLEDSEGQRSLVCCSPWGHKELDTTQQLNKNKYCILNPAGVYSSSRFYIFLVSSGTSIYGNDLHGKSGWPNLYFLSKL